MGWKEPDNKDRDPWDGHSDLDEFIAQLKRRWEQRFGGGSGPFRPRIWWFAVAIIIGIWLLSGVFEVSGGKRAVLTRFGAYVGTAEAGVHWHWPWPVTRTRVVDVSENRSITRNATLITQDGKLVSAAVTVKYHVSDPFRYLYASASPTQVLDTWADAVLLNLVENHSQDALETIRKSQQPLELSKAQSDRIVNLDPGVQIDGVTLSRVEPPEAVTEARTEAEAKHKAKAASEASAESAARAGIAQAQDEAGHIVAQAKSAAQARTAHAAAEVARFKALVPAWRKNPHVTENYLRSESIREALTAAPKIVVSGSVRVVQLPPAAFTNTQAPAAATALSGKKKPGDPAGQGRKWRQ